MIRKRTRQGAAILEFALALPVAILLFLSLADFSLLFLQQARLEIAARTLAGQIAHHARNTRADSRALQSFADLALRSQELKEWTPADITVLAHRHYTCPLEGGGESKLMPERPGCQEERTYISVSLSAMTEPVVRPLTFTGFPRQILSRLTLRIH